MADGTSIEWTDATVNAINGCSVLSPGCKRCYAMKQAHRFEIRRGLTHMTAGGMVWTGEVRFNEKQLLAPLRWKRPRRLFWNAHGDMFHESVPEAWIDRCFIVMALTPHHIHQVLTKRSARMRTYVAGFNWARAIESCRDDSGSSMILNHSINNLMRLFRLCEPFSYDRDASAFPLPNVWLGVSVEDQKRADERIPDLLATPAAVRWLSCEPLLGPVDLNHIHEESDDGCHHSWESSLNGKRFDVWGDGPDIEGCPKIDWVVAGGESGPGARPMHPDWARSLRDQSGAAGVPFLFKQWGEWAPSPLGTERVLANVEADGSYVPSVGVLSLSEALMARVGKKAAGRLLDGVTHDGFPA